METYFNRMMRDVKWWLCTGILLGAVVGMMACGKKAMDGNTEVANQSETPVTEQASEVVPGVIGDEDEEQIRTLIEEFTEAMKHYDFGAIYPYYAVEDYVRGYNMEIAKEIFGDGAIQPTVEVRIKDEAIDCTFFLLGFGSDALSETTEPLNAEVLDRFLNRFAKENRLANLTIKRIDIPVEDIITSDDFHKILKKRCNMYGTENMTYRTALYELDGDTYYCGFNLFCYGGKWEIVDLCCDGLTPVDSTTVTLPCTEEEYLELIGKE